MPRFCVDGHQVIQVAIGTNNLGAGMSVQDTVEGVRAIIEVTAFRSLQTCAAARMPTSAMLRWVNCVDCWWRVGNDCCLHCFQVRSRCSHGRGDERIEPDRAQQRYLATAAPTCVPGTFPLA